MIRAAVAADLVVMQGIEDAAGVLFAQVGMGFVADDPSPSVEQLAVYVDGGRAWVWVEGGVAVGYLVASVVDGAAHLDQVSVRPEFAGRRIGRALLERLVGWAREHGLPAITLTTYTRVAWNGPYYEKCGFRYLADAEITEGLREIRAAEIAHGLDRWPRACMRLTL